MSGPSANFDSRTSGRLLRRPKLRLALFSCPAIFLALLASPAVAFQGAVAKNGTPDVAASQPPATTPAQPPADKQTVITRRVQVVNVPVTVLDKRGFPIIDLTENDFRIFEDGKPQAIKYFRRVPLPPLRIGLVLDTSNSMRPQMNFEKDAASAFAYNILEDRSSKNLIYLQTFDATSSVVQDFTSDNDLLAEKISQLKAGGGKAIYDAVYFACRNKMLNAGPPEDTRRVLVLISDGLDVQSKRTIDEAISMAHRAETVIYTISNAPYGFSNPGDKYLSELARATGGTAYFPLRQGIGSDLETGYLSHGQIGDTSQNKGLGAETGIYSAQRLIHLADALESIGRELDEQYSMGYTPTNATLDGTYRAIRVVALRKGATVRAKAGYFAVAQQ